jgi:hypothetical protein
MVLGDTMVLLSKYRENCMLINVRFLLRTYRLTPSVLLLSAGRLAVDRVTNQSPVRARPVVDTNMTRIESGKL